MKMLKISCLLLTACACVFAAAPARQAEDPWAAYDEAADLAALARLENESMHYRLLRSPHQRGAALWAEFEPALDDFGAARYEALKPLVLGASVDRLQQAVDNGELDYETLTRFYLYRIRESKTIPRAT